MQNFYCAKIRLSKCFCFQLVHILKILSHYIYYCYIDILIDVFFKYRRIIFIYILQIIITFTLNLIRNF